MIGGIIKICGLREPSNIQEVLALNPNWIGLIFYPPSPRFVETPAQLSFLNEEERHSKTVGVFVNPTFEEVLQRHAQVRFRGIQLHGSETPEFCQKFRDMGFTVFKSFGVHSGFDFQITEHYQEYADFLIFDTGSPKFGGTGQQFDWDLLYDYEGTLPFLLSGGISVGTRIFPDHPRFAGVDLNSRFEISPGIKDPDLLKTFMNTFRND